MDTVQIRQQLNDDRRNAAPVRHETPVERSRRFVDKARGTNVSAMCRCLRYFDSYMDYRLHLVPRDVPLRYVDSTSRVESELNWRCPNRAAR